MKEIGKSKGNSTIYLIVVVLAFAVLLTSGKMVNRSAVDKSEKFDISGKRTGEKQQNLQLKDIVFTKVQPTTPPVSKTCDGSTKGYGTLIKDKDNAGACCYYHVYTDACGVCCAGVCVDKDAPQRKAINPGVPPPSDAQYWCDAKPVIYLYPTQPTLVNVKLDVPGSIAESIPVYPPEGWKNILASPDGTFIYQGKKYSELFYEASVVPIKPPENGIIVLTSQLDTQLSSMTSQLGLISHEQKEFLEYWVPKLQSLNSKYILVSVFTPSQKEIIDKVYITPKPDTFIQFIMYYKPLNKIIDVEPLKLSPAPKRVGFTVVEWGGIIDNK